MGRNRNDEEGHAVLEPAGAVYLAHALLGLCKNGARVRLLQGDISAVLKFR